MRRLLGLLALVSISGAAALPGGRPRPSPQGAAVSCRASNAFRAEDYVQPGDGADFAKAINRAANAASAAGPGHCVTLGNVPPYGREVRSRIFLPYVTTNSVYLQGYNGATLTLTAARDSLVTGSLILVWASSQILGGITVDGNLHGDSLTGIGMGGTARYTANKVLGGTYRRFTGWGIQIVGINVEVANAVIRENRFSGIANFWGEGDSHSWIHDNTIDRNGDDGIDNSHTSRTIIEHNTITNNGFRNHTGGDKQGILLTGDRGYPSRGNIVRYNTVSHNAGSGIAVSSGGGRSEHNLVLGNVAEHNGNAGILLEICRDCGRGTSLQYDTIRGNTVRYNGWAGIVFRRADLGTFSQNSAHDNTLEFNQRGFWSAGGALGTTNSFHHNKLRGNTQADVVNEAGAALWSNTTGP